LRAATRRSAAIASGGMATVYLARAVGVGGFERLVAIQVMHAHLAEIPISLRCFSNEARLAGPGSGIPNVVPPSTCRRSRRVSSSSWNTSEGPSLRLLCGACARRNRKLRSTSPFGILVDALTGLHAGPRVPGPQGQLLKLVHATCRLPTSSWAPTASSGLTDFGVARAESRISLHPRGQAQGEDPLYSPEQIMAEELTRLDRRLTRPVA